MSDKTADLSHGAGNRPEIEMEEIQMENRKKKIVDEINALQAQYDAAMEAAFGVDYRLDAPELPDPTPEEIAELESKAAAARREIAVQDYEGKIHDLLEEYAALNGGERPHYSGATQMYMY